MAKLRKDDNQGESEASRKHPLLGGPGAFGLVTGDHPRWPAAAAGHQALGETLRQMGLKSEELTGRYGLPQRSWMVHEPTREQMYVLGKTFGQDAVVFGQNGRHELIYTNGPNTGRSHPALDHEWFDTEPEDYYTHVPSLGGYARLSFDPDSLQPTALGQPAAIDALNARAAHGVDAKPVAKSEIASGLLAVLKKAMDALKVRPHPHAYEWHNEHSDQHLHHIAPGAVLRMSSGQGLAKSDATAQSQDGDSVYAKMAIPFGSVDKSQPQDLRNYFYMGRSREVGQLLKDHGYTSFYAGGKYGRPDLAARNYDTRHLMIHDPGDDAGGDASDEEYTDNWRKVHELAHAMTRDELDKVHGHGRRLGKLGQHRTLREALRTVHGEWLATHKQRELSKQIGIEIPDDAFSRELNTVMHDAVHRVVTGKVTDPCAQGFQPHSHEIPLETALSMVREAAHNLGLTGHHDLVRKSDNMSMNDEKAYEPHEWRLMLAKAIQERVDVYSKTLLDLRQRELRKSDSAYEPAPALNPLDLCPLCGNEDRPGSCSCLQGPLAKADGDKYQYYLVHNETKKLHGGYEFKDDAKDACKDHPDSGKLTVSHRSKIDAGAKESFHRDNKIMGKLHKAELCKSCGKEHGLEKCGLDEVKPGPKLGKDELKPFKTKPKEPVKAQEGSGGKITKGPGLKKTGMGMGATPKPAAPVAAPKPAAPPAGPPAAASGAPKAPSAPTPKVGSPAAKSELAKAALAGMGKMPKEAQAQALHDASRAAAGAATSPPPAPVKLPSAKDHAARAASFSEFTPPAGTAHLKTPPASTRPAPKPAGAGAPVTAGPVMNAARPQAQKPGIFGRLLGKSEDRRMSDFLKSLGDCALCGKAEHYGDCS